MVQHFNHPLRAIPHLTHQEWVVQSNVRLFLANHLCSDAFKKQIEAILSQHLSLPSTLYVRPLSGLRQSELLQTLLPQSCLVVFAVQPMPWRIVLEIDLRLALLIIDKLLAGSGDSQAIVRPLTPTECGIFSFLLLKILKATQALQPQVNPLTLTFERCLFQSQELVPLVADEESFSHLGLSLQIGEQSFAARLLLPNRLCQAKIPGRTEDLSKQAISQQQLQQRLYLLGDVPVTATLRLPLQDLTPEDVANVEVGDIILLEDHQLRLGAAGLEGEIPVYIGRGQNGYFIGLLKHSDSNPGALQLEIKQIIARELPQEIEANMSFDNPQQEDAPVAINEASANLAETVSMLHDIQPAVAVELARLRLTTAQVVRLRAGQTLRLHRGATETVDLVVAGKVFARGELIDVEGELGLRLTEILGQATEVP